MMEVTCRYLLVTLEATSKQNKNLFQKEIVFRFWNYQGVGGLFMQQKIPTGLVFFLYY